MSDTSAEAPTEAAAQMHAEVPADGLEMSQSIRSKAPAGLPVWRTGKPDAFLALAVKEARAAVDEISAPGQVGRHLAVRSEGQRTVTHLFECNMAGYVGWQWFAVLTRISRSKVVTVNEVGLLPSEASVLAPDWVPWAERVRPEDAEDDDEFEAVEAADDSGESEETDESDETDQSDETDDDDIQ